MSDDLLERLRFCASQVSDELRPDCTFTLAASRIEAAERFIEQQAALILAIAPHVDEVGRTKLLAHLRAPTRQPLPMSERQDWIEDARWTAAIDAAEQGRGPAVQ